MSSKEPALTKYPYLGNSPFLIEYFAIVGYNENYYKELIELYESNNKKNTITPSVISSIISRNNDLGIIDNLLIITQVYPNNPNLIKIEFDKNNEKNPMPSPSSMIYSFCFDTYDGKSKTFYVCYGYLFYENYADKYYIPKAFCILSQYPFFTTFKRICSNIRILGTKKHESNITNSKLNFLNLNSNYNRTVSKGNSRTSPKNMEKKLKLSEESNENLNSSNATNVTTMTQSIQRQSPVRLSNDIVIPLEYFIYNIINFIPSPINNNLDLRIFQNIQNKKIDKQDLFIRQLSGYPYIDFDLGNIFDILPLSLVIKIFIFTILEQNMMFFSSNLEKLNMVMYIISIFNYPCNDSTYFWHIISVPKTDVTENYADNQFVCKIMNSLLGVNCDYEENINTESFGPYHFIVDLENKKMFIKRYYDLPQKQMQEVNKYNELLDYVDSIINKKKVVSKFLKKFTVDLFTGLEGILKDFDPNFSLNPKGKNMNFFKYNNNIMKRNKNIQELFYNYMLNILSIFYQDNTFITSKFQKIKRDNRSEEDMEEKLYFLNYNNNETNKAYSNEEKFFCEEFRNTMKYRIYIENFIREYNCINLYKIPLLFSEEFINLIIKDKKGVIKAKLKFLDVIDQYYHANMTRVITYYNFMQFIQETGNFCIYKTLENKKSEQELIKNISNNNQNEDQTQSSNSSSNIISPINKDPQIEIISNTNIFKLSKKLINSYIYFIQNLTKDEKIRIFPSIEAQEKNLIPTIRPKSVINHIEKNLLLLDILENNELMLFSSIYLFSITCFLIDFSVFPIFINSITQKLDENNFLTRNYIYIMMSSFYKFLMLYMSKNMFPNMKINNVKIYFFILLNYLSSHMHLPKEEMMDTIKKFYEIIEDSESDNDSLNQSFEGITIGKSEKVSVFLTYNFNSKGIIKAKDFQENCMKNRTEGNIFTKVDGKDLYTTIKIKIKGKVELSSNVYSPKKIYKLAYEFFDKCFNDENLSPKKVYDSNILKNLLCNVIFYGYYSNGKLPFQFLEKAIIEIVNKKGDVA